MTPLTRTPLSTKTPLNKFKYIIKQNGTPCAIAYQNYSGPNNETNAHTLYKHVSKLQRTKYFIQQHIHASIYTPCITCHNNNSYYMSKVNALLTAQVKLIYIFNIVFYSSQETLHIIYTFVDITIDSKKGEEKLTKLNQTQLKCYSPIRTIQGDNRNTNIINKSVLTSSHQDLYCHRHIRKKYILK